MSYYKSKYRGLIPHLATITSLCLLWGVDGDWGNEETYPKASPLTITRVTRGPKNRGKEKEMEIEEGEGDERCNEAVHWESHPQEQQEIQGGLSPIWNVSPDIRETH